MTLQEAYRLACNTLEVLYDNREAANIANLVMEHLSGYNRMDRLVHAHQSITSSQHTQLQHYLSLLSKHTPVQYVLQETWFYGMCLYVNENVLIPRPETEELADWIIQDEKNRQTKNTRILDIGTGSGCIPVALKKNLPLAEVHAIDISRAALEVAKRNASQQEAPIEFHEIDILQQQQTATLPVFDIIVSNPPYIPQSDKATMHNNVLEHEPHLALFVNDDDPLLFYRAIAAFAKQHLAANGTIYLELHEMLGPGTAALFSQEGFTHTQLRKDMQGKDRMLKVSYQP
ncbi:MAG: peptide chain release factor N(5)-glutamine methyltransferase [Agriterribacter sp.]